MPKEFKDNAFTELGFEHLDDVVANVLKRGRNGSGYEHGVRFESGTGRFYDTTVLPQEVGRIRQVVDGVDPARVSAVAVAGIVHDIKTRAFGSQEGR